MKFLINSLFVAILAMFVAAPAMAADEHGTSQEAVNLVKKTIDFYKKNGGEKTYD